VRAQRFPLPLTKMAALPVIEWSVPVIEWSLSVIERSLLVTFGKRNFWSS